MLVIGLTGGIGSGKTAASDWFATQGIDIIDADVIAREVVQRGKPTLQKITARFGNWVLTQNGELNRTAVREYVFANPAAREMLEAITHPEIAKETQARLKIAGSPYIIIVAPLLLEGGKKGLMQFCNRILVVDVSVQLQIERASKRDNQKREHIQKIIDAQIAREERLSQADDVVDGSRNLPYLHDQLAKLHQKYLALASSS